MRLFSAYIFLLLFSLSISIPSQALDIPSFVQDAVVIVGNWFDSPFESISGLVPPDFDIWRSAKDLGDKANVYTGEILNDAAAQYDSISNKINELKETIDHLVTHAEAMSMILQHVDVEEFQNRFGVELSRTLEELKKEFSESLPEDQTERYQQQTTIIARALDKIEDALVIVCRLWEIPESVVRAKFGDIKPHLNHGLLIIANLVNNHPVLFETLLVSVVLLIIPDAFILKPIIRLFGFGPLGPVRGSFAASTQRFFFGAVVKEGSWFSMLQRAGMKMA